uniref:Uncharacterized protein n=1 Tax=Anguilla anguilla TaxID=7936 RepID=A0A0E9QDM5_ANGAN
MFFHHLYGPANSGSLKIHNHSSLALVFSFWAFGKNASTSPRPVRVEMCKL